jgi:hypothetical protein
MLTYKTTSTLVSFEEPFNVLTVVLAQADSKNKF